MNDSVVTAIKQLSNITAQKDTVLLELRGVCNKQGVFETKLKNPIKLTSNVSHKVSLVSFSATSFFPNLDETSNKFYYSNGTSAKVITLDTGAYNIKDYYETIKMYMIKASDDPKNLVIDLNMATGKVSIILTNGYKVYFNRNNTWRSVLGFNAVDLTTDDIHVSTRIAEVITTYMVYAKCNLCCGTILNGEESNVLFSFPNNKKYASLLSIKPNPLIPIKLAGSIIDKVRVEFTDEDKDPIDFLGSAVFMTLLVEQF